MKKLILFIIILSSTDVFGQVVRRGKEFDKNNSYYLSHDDKASKREIRKINRRKMRDEEDSCRYFRIGIIPYQFLTRSSGIYVGFKFKKLEIEYRPTYTYTTDYNGVGFSIGGYDNFICHGIKILNICKM